MPSIRTKTVSSLTLLLGLLSLACPVQSGNSAASTLMSQAMLSMMNAMGNLAQEYNRNSNWPSSGYYPPSSSWQGMNYAPWGMSGLPGTGVPGQQQMQGFMTQAPAAASGGQTLTPTVPQSPLDGIWQGQGGEMVLAMYGHFRIYANADEYRDGLYEVRGNRIVMLDPVSKKGRVYDFALSEGRLVLRDSDGNMLLFRQLPIPVPPYSLFSGHGQVSSQQQTATDQQKK